MPWPILHHFRHHGSTRPSPGDLHSSLAGSGNAFASLVVSLGTRRREVAVVGDLLFDVDVASIAGPVVVHISACRTRRRSPRDAVPKIARQQCDRAEKIQKSHPVVPPVWCCAEQEATVQEPCHRHRRPRFRTKWSGARRALRRPAQQMRRPRYGIVRGRHWLVATQSAGGPYLRATVNVTAAWISISPVAMGVAGVVSAMAARMARS